MSDIAETRALPLSGSLQSPMRWLLVLTSIPFVIAIAVLATVFLRGNAAGKLPPPLWLLFLIPLIILGAQALLVRGIARANVSLDQGELVVNTGLGIKRVALSRLRRHGVQIIDLDQRGEFKPVLRLWGTGLPGFTAGWFRLRNGEKAVCLLTGRHRVTHLRSDEDRLTLLLSLADPQRLDALLKR